MTFRKTNLLATMSMIALVAAGPALARDMKLFPADSAAPSNSMNIDTARAATQSGAYMPSQSQFRAEKLVGKTLLNAQGKPIGDAESVIVDHGGQITALVVGVGGYLGIGEHRVAIAWKDLQVSNGGKTIETSLSEAQLKALPAYHYKQTASAAPSSRSRKFPKNGSDRDLRMVGGARY